MKPWIGTGTFLVFLAIACSPRSLDRAQELDPTQARQWLTQSNAPYLLDVRNPDEYRAEHLAGSVLIPLPELEGRLGEIPKERPLLLYCHSGRRSTKALELLTQKGFKDLHQIAGGITAWKAAGFPVLAVPTPGAFQ